MSDKMQAYNAFWNSFGLKAYDETSVPNIDVDTQLPLEMPYITYESAQDDLDHPVALVATIWYRSSSWTEPMNKLKDIESIIGRGGVVYAYDNGAFWIKRANPWAQRFADDTDDSVRRIVLNLEVEFID